MRCKDLESKFVSGEFTNFSDEEMLHLTSCPSCSVSLNRAVKAFGLLERQALPNFNPYMTEKILNKILLQKKSTLSYSIRYALVASVVITMLIGSISVYIAYKGSHQPQQYDMLSLNDITQPTIIFDKE